MWPEVILLKLILKDKSSLVSLEGTKSSVSRTFKEQNHKSFVVSSMRSLLELFPEVTLLVG